MVGTISPQPSVESSDLSAVILSITLNIMPNQSDRGDGPIFEARFLVPVCSVSTEYFTDIESKLHLVLNYSNLNTHI